MPLDPLNIYLTKSRTPSNSPRAARYNVRHIISRAYLLLLRTGLYNDACHDFRYWPIAQQFWANFKTYFVTAQRGIHTIHSATHAHAFHQGNAEINNEQHKFRIKTAKAIANLTTATASDWAAVANLTQSKQDLCAQFSAKKSNIMVMHSTITQLKQQMKDISGAEGTRQ